MPDRLATRIAYAVLDIVQDSGYWRIPGSAEEVLAEITRLTDAAIVKVEKLLKED